MEEQKRHNVACSQFSKYFSEYTTHTSLHGLQYVGDKRRTLVERLLWFFIILTSIIICIAFITDSCRKWMNAPIIVSKAFEASPVENIPFPAVTICPENKIVPEVYNFTNDVEKYILNCLGSTNCTIDDAASYRLKVGALLCDSDLFVDLQSISLKSHNTTFNEFLDDIADMTPQGGTDMLVHCRWYNGITKHNCWNKFVPIFTEDGICFSFNMLGRNDIFSNQVIHYKHFGIIHDLTDNASAAYPLSTSASGSGSGLSFMLYTNDTMLDYSCTSLPEAFKVILHDPSDIPRPGKISSTEMTSFIVENKRDIAIRIKPEVFETSDSLRKYSPKRRGCYYPHERQLRYFNEYSEQKCEFECIVNATYRECGCVAYYMPIVDPDTRVCGVDSSLCMINTKENLIFLKNNSKVSCGCFPSCSSISYNVEISSKGYNLNRRIKATGYENMEELAGIEVSKINIFFKESKYFLNTRSELYGFTSFISDCGGLLGLFVGFSIISIIETIYFAFRAVLNVRRQRKDSSSTIEEQNKKNNCADTV